MGVRGEFVKATPRKDRKRKRPDDTSTGAGPWPHPPPAGQNGRSMATNAATAGHGTAGPGSGIVTPGPRHLTGKAAPNLQQRKRQPEPETVPGRSTASTGCLSPRIVAPRRTTRSCDPARCTCPVMAQIQARVPSLSMVCSEDVGSSRAALCSRVMEIWRVAGCCSRMRCCSTRSCRLTESR